MTPVVRAISRWLDRFRNFLTERSLQSIFTQKMFDRTLQGLSIGVQLNDFPIKFDQKFKFVREFCWILLLDFDD